MNHIFTSKLDPELKARWVEALTSGIYRQGRRQLKRTSMDGLEYCCLGVLCEIKGFESIGPHEHLGVYYFGVSDKMLPRALRLEIGLAAEDQDYLARLNDAYRLDFPAIATIIEREI